MNKVTILKILFVTAVIYVVVLLLPEPADSAMVDCIDATCRVKTVESSASMGTGVVFEISDEKVFVLTNAHVATTKRMKLRFWCDGHQLESINGTTILRDKKRDVAVIAVDISEFNGKLPTVIPLAPRDTVLVDGQEVTSVGCPGGSWAKAWSGHVIGGHGFAKTILFKPGPIGGQSGSAIFNADGTLIVALLNRMELNSRGVSVRGMAVNIEEIHDAIYGPETKEVQCGPRGCPRPEEYGGEKGVPTPGKKLGDLRPDVPFVLPEIVPEVVEVPEVPKVELLPGELPGGVLVPEDLADAIKAEPEGPGFREYAQAMLILLAVYAAAFVLFICLKRAFRAR